MRIDYSINEYTSQQYSWLYCSRLDDQYVGENLWEEAEEKKKKSAEPVKGYSSY